MKKFVTLGAILLSAAAVAAINPPYTCDRSRGCSEETIATHDIGGGALLYLPGGWRYFAYPLPRIGDVELREIRAFKNGVVIAITPLPNLDKRLISDEWVRETVTKSASQYVVQSREQRVTYEPLAQQGLVGGLASFTSKVAGDRPFTVLPNRSFASVTTMLISFRYVLFSVSVASEGEPDMDYDQAIQAFRSLK